MVYLVTLNMKVAISRLEIKAQILNILERRGCWGSCQIPKDTIINWLGKKVLDNGKSVSKVIDDLWQDRLIWYHNKQETISLNPHRKQEIYDYIDKYIT